MNSASYRRLAPALMAATVLFASYAAAQSSEFPAKPIHLIVPGTGQIDALARILGPKLTEHFRQPVVIEVQPGAAGILAAHRLSKAPPDGHWLLLVTTGFAIGAALHSSLPYDPRRDFSGVAQIAIPTTVLVASPMLEVESVQQLIAAAKAAPNKLIFGSPGPGSGPHLAGEKLRLAADMRIVHVGMKSGQIMIEAMTGRIHYSFLPLGSVLPFVKDRKLIALAVLTPQRSPLLPDAPAITEVLPAFGRPLGSFGMLAPGSTARPTIHEIAGAVIRIMAMPEVDAWMRSEGMVPSPAAAEAYDRILHAQMDAFAQLIADAGIPRR